ncbi:MAG: BON domain-containing protein [Luteolibacter sp.]
MKTRTANNIRSRFAHYTATALGTVSVALATPQLEPSGDIESSNFLEVDLQADTEMNRADIDVSIADGIATLRGSADCLAQVERSSARAYQSPRVMVVVNEVDIVPSSENEISAGVKDAFGSQHMFSDEDIAVEAEGSEVILRGKVGSWDESELARELASEIKGVTAVKNELNVDFQSVRTDEQTKEQLAFEIKDNPLFAGLDLAPEVKNGVVTWSGQVGSRNEFNSLVSQSYVTGIIKVDPESVAINEDLGIVGFEQKNYTPSQCEEALDVVIARDSRTEDDNISTAYEGGVAILEGTANDYESILAAELNARSIPGVDRVKNQIHVSGNSQLVSSN